MPFIEFPWRRKPPPGVPLDSAKSQNILAYYAFNEAGGGPRDLSGNGHHGTLNGPIWDAGSLLYAGPTDSVDIPNSADLFGMSELSLVVRARYTGDPDTATEKNFIDAWEGGDTNYLFRLNPNVERIGWFTDTSGGVVGGDDFIVPSMDDGNFHCIIAIYDGGKMKVYFDGIKAALELNQTGTIDAGATHIEIGGQIASVVDGWVGSIDQVIIYDRALTLAEAMELSVNPWHLHMPIQIPIGVATAVGAAYSGRGIGRGMARGVYR